MKFIPLDLTDLNSVKNFSEEFNRNYEKCDILINNAGIMMLPEREVSKQGYELQLATNHIGHFLLTKLLLPKINKAENARIINVSSLAHERAKINFEDLHYEKGYDSIKVY